MSIYRANLLLKVNLFTKTLSVFSNRQELHKYTVAIGDPDSPTPTGYFRITDKIINPGGILGSRWLTFYETDDSVWGIHGTNQPISIGKAVSKGCIRMHNEDINYLFSIVPLLTPLHIAYQSN